MSQYGIIIGRIVSCITYNYLSSRVYRDYRVLDSESVIIIIRINQNQYLSLGHHHHGIINTNTIQHHRHRHHDHGIIITIVIIISNPDSYDWSESRSRVQGIISQRPHPLVRHWSAGPPFLPSDPSRRDTLLHCTSSTFFDVLRFFDADVIM